MSDLVTPSLFEPEAAPRTPRRSTTAEEGMARALDHEGDWGRRVVTQRARYLAYLGRPFTCDDVREQDMVAAISPGTYGAVFRQLATAGEIECVGYAKARRPQSHGRIVQVWRGTSVS